MKDNHDCKTGLILILWMQYTHINPLSALCGLLDSLILCLVFVFTYLLKHIFQWVFKTFHLMDITVIITLGFHDVLRYMIYLSFVQCKMCLKTIFVVLKHALNPFFWTFFWAVLFMSGRFKNEVIQCLQCYFLSFIECVGRWVCAIVYGCSQPCWSRAWLKV